MGLLTVLKASDVQDAGSFAGYAQQRLGTSLPCGRDKVVLNTQLKKFWVSNPRATWEMLGTTIDWCVAKRRRPATPWGVLANFRWAWADGVIQLPDVEDTRTERAITRALEEETDENWRRMLIGAEGIDNRRAIYSAWKTRTR